MTNLANDKQRKKLSVRRYETSNLEIGPCFTKVLLHLIPTAKKHFSTGWLSTEHLNVK